MNPIATLKKFLPKSRWGAVGLAPRRESGRLTWSEAEERRQPQDGAFTDADMLMDVPEVSPLRSEPVPVSVNGARKPATALLR